MMIQGNRARMPKRAAGAVPCQPAMGRAGTPQKLPRSTTMRNATSYRNQAAACRKAAKLGRRSSRYLLDLAEHYERLAAQMEAQFAGDKPGAEKNRPLMPRNNV
jgi:hypothetical protein